MHERNIGKGGAIKSAQQYVSGEYVIIQDADLEYNPKDIYALLDRIEIKKVKAIYSSRVLNNEINKKAQNFSHSIRIAGNIFLTKLSNLINNQKLTDATPVINFHSNLFKSIKLQENDFHFAPKLPQKFRN